MILYVMPRFWGIPNASPFCAKLETWLRLADIPYELRELERPPGSKTGKVPYVDLEDGTQLADSGRIIEVLTERHGVTLDAGLTEADRARATAITRLIEDSLYDVTLYVRWKDDAGFAVTAANYFQGAPAFLRPLLAWWIRRGVVRNLWGAGLGRESFEFAMARGVTDLNALSALLGDQPYLLGDAVHGVDATAFGFLTNIRHTPYPGPLKDALMGDARLLAYEQRVRELAWPDWDELPK